MSWLLSSLDFELDSKDRSSAEARRPEALGDDRSSSGLSECWFFPRGFLCKPKPASRPEGSEAFFSAEAAGERLFSARPWSA